MEKAILTCALTGVLTDPKQHPVPVTPEECARIGARGLRCGRVDHSHPLSRRQEPGKGHLPSWDPAVAQAIVDAIRSACPGVIINSTTGVVGPDIAPGRWRFCARLKPEIAACNAGTLNYLKLRANGEWAWPPMVFDNPPSKVKAFLDVMRETGTLPEMECFDTGIVRSVEMYQANGMLSDAHYNLVMGVASGMPVDARLLEILPELHGARRALASDAHRPRGDLAGSPARGGARRHAAHRPRGYVLSARRRSRVGQRRVD